MNVTVSIGISFYPQHGGDSDALLRAADDAMYLAKKEGGNRHLICPVMPHDGSTSRERVAAIPPVVGESPSITLS